MILAVRTEFRLSEELVWGLVTLGARSMEVEGVIASGVRGASVGVVWALHMPAARPRARRSDSAGPGADGAEGGASGAAGPGARRRPRGCTCHRCRRGLLVCFSREACAHTTEVIVALARGDPDEQAALGCDCLSARAYRELPSRIMYYTGPIVVAFALGGMSYCTYMGFTVALPLLAPPRTPAWWMYGGCCATLYANCIFNYLSAALRNPVSPQSAACSSCCQ